MKRRPPAATRRKKESIDELAQHVFDRLRAGDYKNSNDLLESLEVLGAKVAADIRDGVSETGSTLPSGEDIERALNELPAEQRELLSLHAGEGLDSRRIAELKGRPVAEIQKAIADAYVRLRMGGLLPYGPGGQRKN